ncbi:hypothetical protein BHS30_29195 [Klebsiella pneumoniae]|nr:hypothetical protein BHS30_29195 [Klebsiella pneumoniae]
MVSLLIKTELGLEDLSLAEAIKKYPLAKVERPVQYSSREWRSSISARVDGCGDRQRGGADNGGPSRRGGEYGQPVD